MPGSKRRMALFGAALFAMGAQGALAAPAGAGFPPSPHPPAGAPNIVVIMTDDVGFGASSTFGGPVPTPVLDRLAARGLRYVNFHTNALCSPTRAALLTGRNAHEVGFGNVQEMATAEPGYNSLIPTSAATFGRVLRDAGYSTAWFGKNHNVPDWQSGPAGPFDRWPSGLGFDYFYGFNGGETNQFAPALIENGVQREPPVGEPGYILDRDLADHATGWLRRQRASAPDRPFLIYYAPGSAHAPHQAPTEWLARFRGRFSQGWDRAREETFARQTKLGILPAGTALTARPPEIPAWDSLSPTARAVEARMMEAYAAQLAYCDDQIGRLLGEIERQGLADNTLVVFIQGDNGGSAEGGVSGTMNMTLGYNGIPEKIEDMAARIDEIGGPKSNGNYPVGWAWAMNAPFQWTKQIAGYNGGNQNGMVLAWPGHVKNEGTVRRQYHHVVDIAPTLYAAAGVAPPATVGGVAQSPLDGDSLLYSLNAPAAPSPHRTQVYEIMGNRGIYADGWEAATHPRRLPWVPTVGDAAAKPLVWELYHVDRDFSQAHDLAGAQPAKLAEMQDLFDSEAKVRQIFPIDMSLLERSRPEARPYAYNGRSELVFRGAQGRLGAASVPRLTSRSWTISARVVLDRPNASGMIFTQGGRFGGMALMLQDGVPRLSYRFGELDRDMTRLAAEAPLAPGLHDIVASFRYDGGGYGKGGTFDLAVDGKAAGSVRVERTIPFVASEETDIGRDSGTPITDDYVLPFALEGHIETVKLQF